MSVSQRDFSYGELAEIVERIAAWLQSRPATDVKLVGILASRSLAAYAGLLGTCWAGAAYVPLNPEWPEQRLLSILRTTELDALVVDDRGLKLLSSQVLQAGPKHILAPGLAESFDLDDPSCNARVAGLDALPTPDSAHLPKVMGKDDLAYIMFTSGTTGSPKGVMVSTGNVASFLSAMRELYPFSAEDRISQRHELSFDLSVLDCSSHGRRGPLCMYFQPANDGSLSFHPREALTCGSPCRRLLPSCAEMKMLAPGAFPSLRYSLFVASRCLQLPLWLWQEACHNSVIDNIYGPTEATVV